MSIQFDENRDHYFVESDGAWEAKGYKFIISACVSEESLEENILYVTFKDGYLSDFASEGIARDLDEKLG